MYLGFLVYLTLLHEALTFLGYSVKPAGEKRFSYTISPYELVGNGIRRDWGAQTRLSLRQLLKDSLLPHLAAPGASAGDRGAVAASCLSEHVRRPISPLHGSEHTFCRGGMPG